MNTPSVANEATVLTLNYAGKLTDNPFIAPLSTSRARADGKLIKIVHDYQRKVSIKQRTDDQSESASFSTLLPLYHFR